MNKVFSLLDTKVQSILRVFLDHRSELFHLNKLSEESGVSLASCHRIMKELVQNDVVEAVTVGKITLFVVYDVKKVRKNSTQLVDEKIQRILSVLTESDVLFHIQKLSSASNVSLATTFRILKTLNAAGLVEKIIIGKRKLYRRTSRRSKKNA